MIRRSFATLADYNAFTVVVASMPEYVNGDLFFIEETSQLIVLLIEDNRHRLLPVDDDEALSTMINTLTISTNNLGQMIGELRDDIRGLGERVTAVENIRSAATEDTSGLVLEAIDDILTGRIVTSRSNPAIKMFNATPNNYTWTARDTAGFIFSGGFDNGSIEVFHPTQLGEVTLTFTPVFGGFAAATGHIVIESAGG